MILTFGEMFSGIGGFRLGLEKASCNQSPSKERQSKERWNGNLNIRKTQFHSGQLPTFRCVWANDNDKYACQIYRKNFGNKELVEGDIREIKVSEIPDADLLTAGFPCPTFSLAGKRKGFQDTRGQMFFEIARIAKAKKPRFLLLENVKGLLSASASLGTGFYTATKGKSKGEITGNLRIVQSQPKRSWVEITVNVCGGYCFTEMLYTLVELGYDLTEWQMFNSKHFGVPQNRERVFIVGHLGTRSAKQIFPIGQACQVVARASAKAQGERSRFRTANPLGVGGSFGERNLIANTLSKRYYKNGSENLIKVGSLWGFNQCSIYDPEGVAPPLTTCQGGRREPMIVQPCLTPDRPKKGRHGRRFKENGEPMFTLTGQDVHGIALNSKIRRLTPTECERLQGFPDLWTSEGVSKNGEQVKISDTQRYKVLGNAVTTNVVAFLGEKLLEVDVEA